MKHHTILKPGYKILFAALLLLGQLMALISLPSASHACTQLPTQWWYREKMTITHDILPEAVTAEIRYVDYGDSRQTLVISNSSTETLYVLAPEGNADYFSAEEPAGVPEGLMVHADIVDSKRWYEVEQLARIDDQLVDANSWLSIRPESITTPESRSTRLDFLYDGQLYFLNIHIDYQLNEQFSPVQGSAGCDHMYAAETRNDNSGPLMFAAFGTFGIVVLIVGIVLYRRQPRPGKWLE